MTLIQKQAHSQSADLCQG